MRSRRSFLAACVVVPIAAALPRLAAADDTAFVQRCLDRGVQVPVGTYRLSKPLDLEGRRVVIEGCTFYKNDADLFFVGMGESGRITRCSFMCGGNHWTKGMVN